jgi:hypothetical protein
LHFLNIFHLHKSFNLFFQILCNNYGNGYKFLSLDGEVSIEIILYSLTLFYSISTKAQHSGILSSNLAVMSHSL